MKKILAITMAIILTFSLAACKSNKNDLLSSSAPSAIIQDDDFKAPDNYAVVLLASINPQIKLYIDDAGIVLAIEAVNDDAKQVVTNIVFDNTDYQTVIKLFISVANSKGFIKDNAKIDFEIIETKNGEIDTNDILNKASAAATNAANELKIVLNSNIIDEIDTNTETPNNNNNNTQSKPTENTNNSIPTQTTDTHTHNFSGATCIDAAKCDCGVTNGSALGHMWQDATCKAPKTCKVCGATEGNKGEHNFSGGKCTVCGVINTLNPKKDLDTSKEYVGNLKVSGDMLVGGALQFDSEACVVVERYFNSVQTDPNQTPIVFEGKNYYSEGGGMDPHYFEITDTEIIVKGSFWEGDPDAITIKLILQGDGTLKVTYSTNQLFPIGCIFSSNINDVLK